METHPAAEEFPMMDAARFQELVEDIRLHGQREPITLCDGMILDGRNRAAACRELGIEPQTREFHGDPWAYVWSLNGTRRDLGADQRYLIWKHCVEASKAWENEQKRITNEANERKRVVAQDKPRTERGTFEKREEPQVVQVVPLVEEDRHKSHIAKAIASKTNAGAVKRGDALVNKRPDLAEKVRRGDMRPSIAYKQMQKSERESAREEAVSRLSEEAKNKFDEVCDIRHCSMQELLGSGIHLNLRETPSVRTGRDRRLSEGLDARKMAV